MVAAPEQALASSEAEKQVQQTTEKTEGLDPESPQEEVVKIDSLGEPAPQSEDVDGLEDKKKSCCTKRTICMIIGFLVVVAIVVPVTIIQLTPTITKNRAIDSLDVSEASQTIFKELGTATAITAAVLRPSIADSLPFTQEDLRTEVVDLGWVVSTTNTDYGWSPSETLEIDHVIVGDAFCYKIIKEDDVVGDNGSSELSDFLTDEKYVPFKDTIKFLFEDEEVLDDFLTELKLLPRGIENGYVLPIPTHQWEEQSSDEAISRIFWYGIGVVFIMGPDFSELYNGDDELTGFQIDLAYFSDLEVREGFHPYGFKIQFDVDQNVVSIYDPAQDRLLKPSDGQQWEEAKFLARCTTIVVINNREHLQWAHLLSSNSMTRAVTVHLPPNHPIRRMLSVFTLNTNYVNADATAALIPERGWVHRMTSFTYDSLLNLFEAGYKACKIFEPFKDEKVGPGLQTIIDAGRFPYYNEGMAYYQVVHDFVTEWVTRCGEGASDDYALAFYEELVISSKGLAYEVPTYSSDNFIDIVAQLIWVATAYHELVGTITEYGELPNYTGARVVPGKTRADTESYLMGLYLAGRTGLRMPLLVADYENFFGQGEGIPEWEIEVWAGFQDALKVQSDAVQEANAARIANGQPDFQFMDPVVFESSVSL